MSTVESAETAARDGEERAAGEQLSTAPREEPPEPVGIGITGWARWFWRQLTSMRTALLLLLLLALAAVPGSMIPQNGVDQLKVQLFQQDHPTLTPIYEKLQLFDVFSSVWFSAIYLLLFVSLIGCIVPRTWQFVGQLRAAPPRAPRRLDRMPAHASWRTEAAPDEVLDAARGLLRGRRFRVADGEGSVAAEKGYLRETGNLLFHLALVLMLIAFAVGQLWKVEGGKLLVRGHAFANTLTQYDDISSGSFYDYNDLDEFGFTLEEFHSSFEPDGPQKGTPREFRADVTVWEGVDGPERKASIEVNDPLEIGDSKIYLIGHGYAPVVSVTDGQGELAFRGPVPFLPRDEQGTATGVIKVTDYKNAEGERDQLGFPGVFTPTYGLDAELGPHSTFPGLEYPVLSLSGRHGDLGLDSGLSQNVYQLDERNLEPFEDENGEILKKGLRPGESWELPDGAGTLTFEGVERWASFNISQKPASGWALFGSLAAIAGLAGSLFIQRRRVWVRARRDGDGHTVVELAGLGRSESARLPEELNRIVADLAARAEPVEAESATGTEADADAGTKADADAGTKAESATGTKAESDSATEPDAEAGTEDEPEAERGGAAGPADPSPDGSSAVGADHRRRS
ncbi:cytochrome c biogenesis protein ResB [Streptomyces sp. WMMC1477]|uniref:cytochrome c biogenesis protein ResB n=1 Tax=Streptomyces sp. WMMC1477 TaxID=3015155 RepID=UPI0022B70DA3|nr:cytochrome c biogenesis protein ResB [Streptomyces sp. WMMC1477]MCZ7432769.1 cytochrome c biogenesis protein ResB [Streptomyces sp. WMMC1477]